MDVDPSILDELPEPGRMAKIRTLTDEDIERKRLETEWFRKGNGEDTSAVERIPPVVVGLLDFLQRELPPREHVLKPWLPAQGLAMLYAPRGVGKTQLALDIAYAITAASKVLRWEAPVPRGVLYLDGEMPAPTVQERLAAVVASASADSSAPFIIMTPDLQHPERGMPDLATFDGREEVDAVIDAYNIQVIVVDNLSTLVRASKENEAEGWLPVQDWALKHRARGRTVLFIHHAGKGGNQRGTSRREDVLDTVIALRRPADYTPDQGATFELHFEKSRGLCGDEAAPLEAQLTTVDGRRCWTWRTLEDSTYERVIDLLNDGISQAEIARELEVNRSTVSRYARKAREGGRLSKDEGAP